MAAQPYTSLLSTSKDYSINQHAASIDLLLKLGDQTLMDETTHLSTIANQHNKALVPLILFLRQFRQRSDEFSLLLERSLSASEVQNLFDLAELRFHKGIDDVDILIGTFIRGVLMKQVMRSVRRRMANMAWRLPL
jgi:hypothetical protein